MQAAHSILTSENSRAERGLPRLWKMFSTEAFQCARAKGSPVESGKQC